MRLLTVGAAGLWVAMSPLPSMAESVETLYQHKAWVVQGVTFDDGSYACLAEVSDPGESF